MSVEKAEILFNGKLVGWMISPKVDNFEIYGDWKPNAECDLDSLLNILNAEGEASVEIFKGKSPVSGVISIEPEDKIEIKMYPE